MPAFARFTIVLGSPGAGKDTQLELLERACGAQILYIGQTIRRAAETNKNIEQYLESGALVPQSIITTLYELKLQEFGPTDWLISDGFPRSVEQADWLEQLLNQSFTSISEVILLDIPQSEALDRLKKRARHDDTNNTVVQRFETFERETGPVIERYKSAGLLKVVDGVGSIEQVFDRFKIALGVS